MEKDYVSDVTVFINHFLEEHPEVVEDQHRGWNIYWDHKVDFAELREAEEDRVADDVYGFNPVLALRARHAHSGGEHRG